MSLDRTLVHIVIPSEKQVSYIESGKGRGIRKRCQNVFAMCDFDIVSTFYERDGKE